MPGAFFYQESSIMSTASAPSAAGTTTWNIDNSHTLVEFSVRHLMISTVKGRFGEVSGKVVAHDADPAQAQIDVTINAASIDTREPQRDAHLRSADFFDAENFPTLTFRSTRIEKASGDDLKVTGDLTIRGTTREVVLDVTSEGRVKDPWGGERAGYSATTKIKRSDYGLTWNVALEAGGVVVGDDIKIALEVELVKQA
jgi:polyisoprenoid-binding protein YceI